jgi:trehalose 6-phosphate synthase
MDGSQTVSSNPREEKTWKVLGDIESMDSTWSLAGFLKENFSFKKSRETYMDTPVKNYSSVSAPPGEVLSQYGFEKAKKVLQKTLGHSSLCIVTSREPIVFGQGSDLKYPAGGVSQALHALLEQSGGIWIACRDSGGPDSFPVPSDKGPGYLLHRVDISDSVQKDSYNRYSNGLLWPLFHGNGEYISSSTGDFLHYDQVNQLFAHKVLETLKEERPGLVWIHDYQLMRVAYWIRNECRQTLPPLAFFCHIPWPSLSDFVKIPESKALLESVLAHDIAGFQTSRDRDRFLAAVWTFLPEAKMKGKGQLVWSNRTIQTKVMAIGIDSSHFLNLSLQPENVSFAKAFLQELEISPESPFMISVDRMDYTKGFFERLSILDSFFTLFPQWRGQVSFLQIAVPTRSSQKAYETYQKRLRVAIHEFNSKWSSCGWVPLRSVETTLSQPHLAGLYRMARGALITSTNDGMNLVAQEYLACQGNGSGTLFLSCRTGSARTLKEAVLIDPCSPILSARILHFGLTEKLSKRISRNISLNQRISNSLYVWLILLLETVGEYLGQKGDKQS